MDTTASMMSTSMKSVDVSQKRNWYARESIMEVLQSLGLPTTMDATHTIVKGIASLAQWLVASSDDNFAIALGGGTPKFAKALETFRVEAGAISVNHIMSPGISFSCRGPMLDGAAMKVRIAKGNANEGPVGYVVPVHAQMFDTGQEWCQYVALVPNQNIMDWMRMMAAAESANRVLDVSRLTLRSYNGNDQQIQPMALDDIIMDAAIKSSFVDDVMGFLSRRNWYTERRLPWSRKYLLNGPPGTGKTSLARWAASSLNMPAYTFDFTDRYADGHTFVGFMNWAQRNSPSIIILDDVDKVLGNKENNRTGVTPHTLLTCFSGMGSTDGTIMVATSNSTEPFKGPMRRRFDSIIEVPLPTPDLQAVYLKGLLAKDGVSDADIEGIVKNTAGWSFDDLRALVTAAANFVVKRNADKIGGGELAMGYKLIKERRENAE